MWKNSIIVAGLLAFTCGSVVPVLAASREPAAASQKKPLSPALVLFGLPIGKAFEWSHCEINGSIPEGKTFCLYEDSKPPEAITVGYAAYKPKFANSLPGAFDASDLHVKIATATNTIEDIEMRFPLAFESMIVPSIGAKFGRPTAVLRRDRDGYDVEWAFGDGSKLFLSAESLIQTGMMDAASRAEIRRRIDAVSKHERQYRPL